MLLGGHADVTLKFQGFHGVHRAVLKHRSCVTHRWQVMLSPEASKLFRFKIVVSHPNKPHVSLVTEIEKAYLCSGRHLR